MHQCHLVPKQILVLRDLLLVDVGLHELIEQFSEVCLQLTGYLLVVPHGNHCVQPLQFKFALVRTHLSIEIGLRALTHGDLPFKGLDLGRFLVLEVSLLLGFLKCTFPERLRVLRFWNVVGDATEILD